MMFSWYKEVKEIHYDASFPIGELEFIDDTLPIKIHSEFTSPFVPLDSRVSGTPGFYATFYIENVTGEDVEVSLLGKLKNPINRGIKDRQLRNILNENSDHMSITMKSDVTNSNQQNGSVSFSVTGGEPSYIKGDFSAFFSNYVLNGDFGTTEESYLFNFRETGKLPNLGSETVPHYIMNLTDEQLDLLSDLQVEDILAHIIQIASACSPYRRILEVEKDLLADRKGKIKFICFIKSKMQELLTDNEGQEAWGDAALSSNITLRPGEKKEIQFIVSWFFPNHYSDVGNFVGHMYTNWFKDSKEVNDYMFKHSNNILNKVRRFSKELRNTDTNLSMVNNWVNQLNTIIKCSWWSREGDFAIWEGYGSYGFHTMDITYQGSFNILALFPDLQLRQMEMGAKFQREDGRVHHFFTPDFSSVDDGFSRIDMNPQFVLLVCRDYLWTGDLEYVKRLWKSVVKAMESIEKLDSNDDAIELSENVEQRYLNAGRIFNHEECGDHYYRAMSSWSLLLSMTGFKLDVPKKTVTFTPPVESIKGPWFSPSGFGHFEKKPEAFELICSYGEISFSKLILNMPKIINQVCVNDESISFEMIEEDNQKIVIFDKIIVLRPDMTLKVLSN